jgi:hypothetical protein
MRLRHGEIVAGATGAQIMVLAEKIETAMWPPAELAVPYGQ